MYLVIAPGALWSFTDWCEAWHFATELKDSLPVAQLHHDSVYVYGPETL